MTAVDEESEAGGLALEPPPGYDDLHLCGTGATSVVYRAVDDRTGHEVALKRLHRHMLRSEEALARLRRELKALTRLNHPAIVKVIDVIAWDGDPTIVMDYVPGRDLKERLEQEGPLPADEAERIARTLFDVLATTHGAGIVHRDVKPQNVRLTPDGEVFLLDFGSARLDATSQLTGTGTTVGTPEYMAPELFVGSVYDPRVDIYGVGATLFEALTGRPPQVADSLAELAYLRTREAIEEVATLRDDVPLALGQVVDRCLRRQPEARYATAALAVWALDHPEEERLFQARRSSHPTCIHCHQELAPTAAVCPRCKSTAPFSYDRGLFHVEIDTVEDPQRFIERAVTDAPAMASVEHVRALATRCAALSFSRQRYLSFIDRDQARRTVKELAEIGVTSHVATEPRSVFWLIPALVLIPCMPFVVLLPLAERFNSYFNARHGMLSTSHFPAPLWSAMRKLLLLAAAALLVGEFVFGVEPADTASLLGFTVGLLVVGVTYVVASFVRLRRPRLDLSPEPGWEDQLRGVFSLSRREGVTQPARAAKSVGAGTYSFFLFLFVLLVPLEILLLHAEGDVLNPSDRGFSVLSLHSSPPPVVDRDVRRQLEAQDRAVREAQGPSAASRALLQRRRDRWSAGEEARSSLAVAWGAAVVPVLLCLLLLAVLERRRRRIKVEAEAIMRDLDWSVLGSLGARSLPAQSTMDFGPSPVAQVALTPSSGQFSGAAIARATDLAACLNDDDTARLQAAIAAVGEEERCGSAASERSLLSRCIMETDAESSARLQFLALEGQLEAQAAMEWARALRGSSV